LILEKLRSTFPQSKPALGEIYPLLEEITKTLAEYGIFNYLLSDGEHLFAHCSTNLHYIVRQAPFASAHSIDEDVTVDFRELTNEDDRVAVIATFPLTDNEVWTQIQPGELLVFQDGLPVNLGPLELS
jgi:glutamine amidotransferase